MFQIIRDCAHHFKLKVKFHGGEKHVKKYKNYFYVVHVNN